MWVRMAQHYAFAYTPEVLADYRQHNNSITGVKFLNGGIMKDTKRVFELIQSYLPEPERRATIKKARKRSANYGLQIAKIVWHQTQNTQYVNANVKQIISMYNADPSIYAEISRLYIQMFKTRIKKVRSAFKRRLKM